MQILLSSVTRLSCHVIMHDATLNDLLITVMPEINECYLVALSQTMCEIMMNVHNKKSNRKYVPHSRLKSFKIAHHSKC